MKRKVNIKFINFVSLFLIAAYVIRTLLFKFDVFHETLKLYSELVTGMLGVITMVLNIGISIWLYIDSRKHKQPALVWAMLSLFFGLIAIVAYYWRLLYLKSLSNE